MTPRKDWIHSLEPISWGVKLADGSIIYAEGKGTAALIPEELPNTISFHDVLYIPRLSNNLLSSNSLTVREGYELSKGHADEFPKRGDCRVQSFTASVKDNNLAYA
jgi:hypothetical protein